MIAIKLGWRYESFNVTACPSVFGYPYNTNPCICTSTWLKRFCISPFIIESFTIVFFFIFYNNNLPISVFLEICSANCYLANTKANPNLLANFLATVVRVDWFPPMIRTAAGLFGRLDLILNFKRRAISSKMYSREPWEQSTSK